MNKRGQVTAYIILGILILAISVGLYVGKDFLKSELGLGKTQLIILSSQAAQVREYVKDCVKSSLIDAVRLVGLQGGYVITPETALKTNFSSISYGYYNGKNVLIDLKDIEGQISLYNKVIIPLCFDVTNFPSLNITSKEIIATTKINRDSVSISVNYPTSISKGSSVYELQDRYFLSIPIRLGRIHDLADKIIQNEIKRPGAIDLTYLMNSNYDIAILPYDYQTIIYSITDQNSKIKEIPYTFMFANKIK